MRLLILGGSQFLGRAIAVQACAAGHDVTCAARGLSGPIASGARFVQVDRDVSDGLEPLAREAFDAVVDVSRHPGQVRRAVAALKRPSVHWTFVSTVSVYADNRTPGQRADTAPLRPPTAPEIEHGSDETFGAAKVACEQAVGENAFICRAGLLVGPEDPIPAASPIGRHGWPGAARCWRLERPMMRFSSSMCATSRDGSFMPRKPASPGSMTELGRYAPAANC
jgi:2'-hydroxyisoflavone reductase